MMGLILDQDEAVVEKWKKRIRMWDPQAMVISCGTKEDGLHLAKVFRLDFFIVELVLEGDGNYRTSGLEFATEIRKYPSYGLTPLIICTKVSDELSLVYPKTHCYHYLQKPVKLSIMDECCELFLKASRIRRIVDAHGDYVTIRKNRCVILVDINDIVKIEIHRNEAFLVLVDDIVEIDSRLAGRLKEELMERFFIQCNRSDYVNRKYIKMYYNGLLHLKQGFGTVDVTALGKRELQKLDFGDSKTHLE